MEEQIQTIFDRFDSDKTPELFEEVHKEINSIHAKLVEYKKTLSESFNSSLDSISVKLEENMFKFIDKH